MIAEIFDNTHEKQEVFNDFDRERIRLLNVKLKDTGAELLWVFKASILGTDSSFYLVLVKQECMIDGKQQECRLLDIFSTGFEPWVTGLESWIDKRRHKSLSIIIRSLGIGGEELRSLLVTTDDEAMVSEAVDSSSPRA